MPQSWYGKDCEGKGRMLNDRIGWYRTEDQENLITETALRGYWNYYHDVMGFS